MYIFGIFSNFQFGWTEEELSGSQALQQHFKQDNRTARPNKDPKIIPTIPPGVIHLVSPKQDVPSGQHVCLMVEQQWYPEGQCNVLSEKSFPQYKDVVASRRQDQNIM